MRVCFGYDSKLQKRRIHCNLYVALDEKITPTAE